MDQAAQAAQNAEAIKNIINGVLSTVAIIAPLASLGTFGVTEFAKKIGLSSRWAGVFSAVIGFGISVLVTGVASGSYFSGVSILIGVMVATGTSGVYSIAKSAASKPTNPQE